MVAHNCSSESGGTESFSKTATKCGSNTRDASVSTGEDLIGVDREAADRFFEIVIGELHTLLVYGPSPGASASERNLKVLNLRSNPRAGFFDIAVERST